MGEDPKKVFLVGCPSLDLIDKKNLRIDKKFKRKFRSTIHLSKRLIDIKLDKLIDIKNMQNDYENFEVLNLS